MMSYLKRTLGWVWRGLLATIAVYALLLTYPQPLFAYELRYAGIALHADRPIPGAMRATLERVRARLDRSPIAEPGRVQDVFVCMSRWRFALFARNNYRVGGIANVYVGQQVFLRESDMAHDRLIGPGGQPVAADRPLSYFITHEIMHIEQGRRLGASPTSGCRSGSTMGMPISWGGTSTSGRRCRRSSPARASWIRRARGCICAIS